MNKYLLLIACSYPYFCNAEANKTTCAIESVDQGHNRVAFFYTQPVNAHKAFFYVNAMSDREISEKSLGAILANGKPLAPVPNSQPPAYLPPEDAKVLNILTSKIRIDELGSLTEITPNLKNTSNLSRNASNYPDLLPPETTTLANGVAVNICRFKI